MKKKPKEPTVPAERHETIRREIVAVLSDIPMSAREISASARISEKEVYDHLDHIRKTMNKRERHLIISPAECMKCGFVFAKRERLRKPGRCPVCKGEQIQEPMFSIAEVLP